MSRSHKSAPVYSGASNKFYQRVAHSRLRLHTKERIRRCLDEERDWDALLLPTMREVANIWDTSKEDRHLIRPRWRNDLKAFHPDGAQLHKLARK